MYIDRTQITHYKDNRRLIQFHDTLYNALIVVYKCLHAKTVELYEDRWVADLPFRRRKKK